MNPEEIAAKVVAACVPLAQRGTRFVAIVPGSCIESPRPSVLGFTLSAQVDPEAVLEACVRIKVPIPEEDVFDGTIEIRVRCNRVVEFYWTFAAGSIQFTPMPVIRQRGELAGAVRVNLDNLGGTADEVRAKLVWMGCDPDLSGLASYIAKIFGLKHVKIELVPRHGRQIPQISANRPRSSVTLLLEDDFSAAMAAFLDQELRPRE
jgi:hypothetical protein